MFYGLLGDRTLKRVDVACPMTDVSAGVLHALRIRRPLYAQGVIYR